MSETLLKLDRWSVGRGESSILDSVSLVVGHGECVALIGANGAGKTTLVESILGMHRQLTGTLEFEGQDLSQVPLHRRCSLGLAWVPEGRRLFGDMTVRENLELGATHQPSSQTWDELHALFPVLRERERQLAGTLSGGEQQMVALARALISRPKLLLIDEMSIGLSPKFTLLVFQALDAIRKKGIGILLVEQNAMLALRHSERAYVLEQGRIRLSGASAELAQSPEVRNAYLGL